jgi:hypothetical protein
MFGGCARARHPESGAGYEKKFTKKADVVKALVDSIAFCDQPSALTDRVRKSK